MTVGPIYSNIGSNNYLLMQAYQKSVEEDIDLVYRFNSDDFMEVLDPNSTEALEMYDIV